MFGPQFLPQQVDDEGREDEDNDDDSDPGVAVLQVRNSEQHLPAREVGLLIVLSLRVVDDVEELRSYLSLGTHFDLERSLALTLEM